MTSLPEAPLSRVLDREDHIWHGDSGGAPHIFMYGATGSAKSSLIKAHLTRLCQQERVLIVEVKRQADPVYQGPPEDPHRFGRPVREICPRFGYEGDDGGGPMGMWYRIIGAPDRGDTARRIGAALEIVANEGHTILVLDDVKTTCKSLGLDEQVGEAMSLGRSAGVCCILSTTETSYVAGRSQGGLIWVGHTGGSIPAAKAGAALLGWRGKEREDFCGTIPRYTWIFSETEAGNMGPVLTRTTRS